MLKGNVLQLPGNVVEAQARGNRRVDFQRLAGDPATLVRSHGGHGLQVVQTVGQFDQHDAHIARHGHQHLAEVFGLHILIGLELKPFELRDSIDQFGDGAAITGSNFCLGNLGILHDIMEQCGDDDLRIHPPFGQRTGNGQRMGHIRFAGKALLPLMGSFTEAVSLDDLCDLGRFEIAQRIDEDLIGRIVVLIDSGILRSGRGRDVRGRISRRGIGVHDGSPRRQRQDWPRLSISRP